uniref:Uncharacterized protein n=1 Tax=Oryza sativa subsp. japonica TaxID=39947 RepID=Q6ZIJ5_ORYSJ|nr:hypothetical protein [Oryza sativa Japonica Group]BAD31065.1 hypothetical protein [Oryza sativa Japonica Group]
MTLYRMCPFGGQKFRAKGFPRTPFQKSLPLWQTTILRGWERAYVVRDADWHQELEEGYLNPSAEAYFQEQAKYDFSWFQA